MAKDFLAQEFDAEFNNGQPWDEGDAQKLYNELRQEVLTLTGQRLEWYLRVLRKINRYVGMHRQLAVKEDRALWNAQQELLAALEEAAVAVPIAPTGSRFVQ